MRMLNVVGSFSTLPHLFRRRQEVKTKVKKTEVTDIWSYGFHLFNMITSERDVSPPRLVVASKEVSGRFVRLCRFVILVNVVAQQPCMVEDTAFSNSARELKTTFEANY